MMHRLLLKDAAQPSGDAGSRSAQGPQPLGCHSGGWKRRSCAKGEGPTVTPGLTTHKSKSRGGFGRGFHSARWCCAARPHLAVQPQYPSPPGAQQRAGVRSSQGSPGL